MSKVRIECYIELATFYKLNQLKEANGEKGYSKITNEILKRHFSNLTQQDQAVSSLNQVIQRYVTEIKELRDENLKLKMNQKEETTK